MIPVIIYLGIGLLVFFFILFTNVVNPAIEEDDLNMIIVSWICQFLLCLIIWPVVLSMIFIIIKAFQSKKMHKYITGFGLVKIVEVYDATTEPVLFLAKSKKGDLFLGFLVEDNEDIKQCWYLPLSKHRLSLLKEGEIEIKEALLHPESEKLLSVLRDKVTKNEYNEWIHYNDLPYHFVSRMCITLNKGGHNAISS